MSTDYEDERAAALADNELAQTAHGIEVRAEYAKSAQVHATLAVAAALSWPPQRYMPGIDEGQAIAEARTAVRILPEYVNGLTLPDAFTGSERADEVGA